MATIWSRINTIILLLVLFALLAVLAMLARDARSGPLDPPAAPGSTDSVRLPGTPISGPTTITQSGRYYLTRNISVTGAQTAITIDSSNVTFDLGGFTIDGDDNAGSLGISVGAGGYRNITVRNGVLSDFLIGLNADFGANVVIEQITVESNVVGMEVSDASVVSGCTAVRNTTGISALQPVALDFFPVAAIHDCLIVDNLTYGVYGDIPVRIHDSDLWDNTTDLSTVAGSVILHSTYCTGGLGSTFVGSHDGCP